MAPAFAGLDAVLFDLDGTLVDSERDNVESVARAVRRLGRELSAAERAFVIGHSWNEIHALVCRNHGLAVPLDALIASAVDEKRALMAATGYRALPGAVALVRRLAGRVRLAVVSGASRVEVKDAVEALALGPLFEVLLGAEDYRRGKPDPEPYRLAIARLGVDAAACVVVEDAPPGIAAGRAAGARVVGVQAGNFAGHDLSTAHLVLDSLEGLDDATLDRLVTP